MRTAQGITFPHQQARGQTLEVFEVSVFLKEIRRTRDFISSELKGLPKANSWKDHRVANADRQLEQFVEQQGNVPLERMRDTIRSFARTYFTIRMAIAPRLLSIIRSLEVIEDSDIGLQTVFNEARAITERVAALDRLQAVIEREAQNELDESSFFLEVGDLARENAIGTRFNWRELHDKEFHKISKTDYMRAPEDPVDYKAKSILNAIDNCGKTVPGLRPFYDFCCEFVHPNVGEMLLVKRGEERKSKDNRTLSIVLDDQLLVRDLADINADGELRLVLTAMSYLQNVQPAVRTIVGKVSKTGKRCGRIHQKRIHRLTKGQPRLFTKDDLCPCGSGLIVKICVKN